jgi:adenylate kinase family enzyme
MGQHVLQEARRIRVVGHAGSGKSTLSQQLAVALDLVHIEMDALYHQPGWTPATSEAFHEALRERMSGDGWVLDGNYNSVLEPDVLASVDVVVWLDLPRRTVLPALLGRTLRRGLTREVLWNGNTERLGNLLKPRPEDNLLLWVLSRWERTRRKYETLMQQPEVRVIRLCSRAEVQRLVETLGR